MFLVPCISSFFLVPGGPSALECMDAEQLDAATVFIMILIVSDDMNPIIS